ncbi:hypothetical protein L1987_26451 [Smallanthus sonchifolius]|uniref:Uncharacterized protein n=1 Tax=Smallanthus sonchifolius TaxID=185202 RepID=A0ACB9IB40_9ASTR|nr:hypothetical protein L1987_26451 [Smallanthus sonchifolius]
MTRNISSFLSILAFLATLHLTVAVEYSVTNLAAATPGGNKFINYIGDEYTRKTLPSVTSFIWNTFQQDTFTHKPNILLVRVFIDEVLKIGDTEVPAYTLNNDIHVSAKYIQGYTGDVKTEFTGILYHEMTHVWQWFGKGQAPTWVTEGIADYVRLKAGYPARGWVNPGEGNRWDEGYSVTARFLDYCNGLRNGFVAELNKKLRDGYSDHFFVELLGKPVDQLWAEYKA